MCVGIPMQILSRDGIAATARDGDSERLIDLSLTGPLAPGTWVLTFLGAAREVLPEDEAQKIRAALDGLGALMAGGELGDAFADLESRGPTLPPHLAAAQAAGKTHA
ncbi:HypC/HybG/HupF family hydrogenase formation chaperone [Roseibacterium beibuensis]|uniref:HypC/HybG/HupF family hydrogenase formation chaperone n=1 Tax=[Roseibacterium] beibuensis TaxID=1193142 RepID=A0ABP9KYU2_9RHOB|nr:HypC/HybG/HupF family hydrogenase formation chaperone [Roseibacterium beibuensis]MCS6622010.1 HypC/HybG/HupF family hydrogenase formation chaperone [Roseibacterium beibuensis]